MKLILLGSKKDITNNGFLINIYSKLAGLFKVSEPSLELVEGSRRSEEEHSPPSSATCPTTTWANGLIHRVNMRIK